MPLLKPFKLEDSEYLYKRNAFADEVFIIAKGRINMLLKDSEIVFTSYLKGSFCG